MFKLDTIRRLFLQLIVGNCSAHFVVSLSHFEPSRRSQTGERSAHLVASPIRKGGYSALRSCSRSAQAGPVFTYLQ